MKRSIFVEELHRFEEIPSITKITLPRFNVLSNVPANSRISASTLCSSQPYTYLFKKLAYEATPSELQILKPLTYYE